MRGADGGDGGAGGAGRRAGKTTRKSVTIHHLASVEGVGEVGPGWEYYLDLLVAARDGAADTAAPSFDDYYPAQRDYFTSLT
ncbi:hypothetical protein OG946_18460 [Streptomyces sp. NBC_01808]|uniref:hypothetical protein n=1 Tax=Streptomyces sp. NBC_01808 TaxID=2975947 RepID=UPI002DDB29DD|nr:hypothetical protein [Streptomyces sp. NBC_01808]WSA39167.1 hypothetical protein OG946_18460 [Streptomyces sp. NBC_01808]